MDKDINKNLTPEQAQGIEKQDVTKGIVDVDILEQSPSQIPEQQPSGTLASTLANAETVNEQAQEDRTKRELAEAERIKQQDKVKEQELLTRTLGQETLGQGEAEQEAIANSSIGTAQAQIDSLDQAILASSKALKAAEVQDALDVKKISTNSRGVPASIVRGQQAILAAERRAERNLEAIELENDIATSALLQGKVDSAQKAIERAIKLKFDDKKAELTLEKEWLARSDRDLSEAKANELREVEKEEAEAQSVFDIAAQARQAGAGQKEINAILNAKNRDEALSNAGSLGSLARLDLQLKRMNINSKSLSIKQQKAKLKELQTGKNSINIKPDFQAATFAKRMADANSVLSTTERDIGEKIGSILTVGLSNREERQKREQAERNFINALLRKESGAAISPEEFDSAREQYFPNATDTKETRKQKEENRNVVFEGMRISSGDAYDYLVSEIEAGSPDSLLDSFNQEETPEDFLSNL